MFTRTAIILTLSVAVFAGGGLGTSNGMVLCIDGDGHLAIEAPHLKHAHSHAQGADHERHDHDRDADHGDLHDLLATCSDSFLIVQKLERASSSVVADQHYLAPLSLCLPACLVSAVPPFAVTDGLSAPAFRGGTARAELVSLRSVVLLV